MNRSINSTGRRSVSCSSCSQIGNEVSRYWARRKACRRRYGSTLNSKPTQTQDPYTKGFSFCPTHSLFSLCVCLYLILYSIVRTYIQSYSRSSIQFSIISPTTSRHDTFKHSLPIQQSSHVRKKEKKHTQKERNYPKAGNITFVLTFTLTHLSPFQMAIKNFAGQ